MTFKEWWQGQSERYRAAMLREDLREVWEAAVLAEREACARVCDTEWNGDADSYGDAEACNECAELIRARSSEKPHD